MFWLIKKMFMGLLISIVNASNHTKCISLSCQECMIQPTLINLHPNEGSQEFHYYPFAVKLDVLEDNDLSNKVCIPNKTRFKSNCVQHDYRNKFSKTLTKHIMRM